VCRVHGFTEASAPGFYMCAWVKVAHGPYPASRCFGDMFLRDADADADAGRRDT
jgi:hypothetical protein